MQVETAALRVLFFRSQVTMIPSNSHLGVTGYEILQYGRFSTYSSSNLYQELILYQFINFSSIGPDHKTCQVLFPKLKNIDISDIQLENTKVDSGIPGDPAMKPIPPGRRRRSGLVRRNLRVQINP
ncbi:hypothetical protein Leryth_023826 [Lithospermum erythrorhizon]|nr:hypothetical protein Leryth_023826 [Lithospermum erythrorhizon]